MRSNSKMPLTAKRITMIGIFVMAQSADTPLPIVMGDGRFRSRDLILWLFLGFFLSFMYTGIWGMVVA